MSPPPARRCLSALVVGVAVFLLAFCGPIGALVWLIGHREDGGVPAWLEIEVPAPFGGLLVLAGYFLVCLGLGVASAFWTLWRSGMGK